MERALRVLLVEDSPDDAALLLRHLTRAGYEVRLHRVETRAAMAAALDGQEWDVVIADYILPQFSALGALALLKERELDLPFIIVSGAIGEQTAVDAMRAGAHDYLMKGSLTRLAPAIEREMHEAAVRRERLRALEVSARLGRILDNSSNEIFVFDAETFRFIQVNRGARQNLGYTMAELEQMTPLDLVPGCRREHLISQMAPLLAGERDQVVIQTLLRRKDGSNYPVEVRLQLSRSERPPVYVAMALDVTERLRVEAELKAANSAKDRFLAILSHELRNPLAAINSAADALLLRTGQYPWLGRTVDVIKRNVELQARLVEDLLNLSSVVRGKVQLEPRPTRLDEVISRVVEQMWPRAAEAGVRLEMDLPGPVWLSGDAARLEQVMLNLVDNALKFTPAGGRVGVALRTTGSEAEVTVQDSGLGVDPADLPHLFNIFWQGQHGDRRRPGLGIGLAVARQLVELHGGQLRAESEGLGRGSRFFVRLPVIPAPDPASPADTSDLPLAPLRVLLVDDNEDLLSVTVQILELEGWEVVHASHPDDALALLSRHQPPDVVVSDLDLPGMDGAEFLGRVRQLPGLARVPALALTGYSTQSHAKAARDAGFSQYLVKPVDVDQLIRCIRAAVQTTGAQPAQAADRPYRERSGAR